MVVMTKYESKFATKSKLTQRSKSVSSTPTISMSPTLLAPTVVPPASLVPTLTPTVSPTQDDLGTVILRSTDYVDLCLDVHTCLRGEPLATTGFSCNMNWNEQCFEFLDNKLYNPDRGACFRTFQSCGSELGTYGSCDRAPEFYMEGSALRSGGGCLGQINANLNQRNEFNTLTSCFRLFTNWEVVQVGP